MTWQQHGRCFPSSPKMSIHFQLASQKISRQPQSACSSHLGSTNHATDRGSMMRNGQTVLTVWARLKHLCVTHTPQDASGQLCPLKPVANTPWIRPRQRVAATKHHLPAPLPNGCAPALLLPRHFSDPRPLAMDKDWHPASALNVFATAACHHVEALLVPSVAHRNPLH